METALSLLKQQGVLQQWSDQKILPGQRISDTIRRKMDESDIFVFLFSPDFIESSECMKEWSYALSLSSRERPLFRIPIIIRECSWMDVLGDDDVLALPTDGTPVARFNDKDVAWNQVYDGIKRVIEELREIFTLKEEFRKTTEQTDFISQSHLGLQDIFVFPRITVVDEVELAQQRTIVDLKDLLATKYALIHGEEKSGKSALARHVFLSLVEESQPVLLVHSGQMGHKPFEAVIADSYKEQFHGDYTLWNRQANKTLILDDVNDAPKLVDMVVKAVSVFDRIIVTLSSDFYHSYFRDEVRLSEFSHLKIEPLTRPQQEALIRKRLELSQLVQPLTDGYIDEVEKEVESVTLTERILPRYPFYVLTILQTYEAYMPGSVSVTSYGHCYYVLIVANLRRAGISNTDDAINACFNFAEQLAFAIFRQRQSADVNTFDFDGFIEDYKKKFIIPSSTINRLQHGQFGIIGDNGLFKTDYMYYYFLGKFLAGHGREMDDIVGTMCDESYKEANYLTLLFTIHHTMDETLIDDIALRTISTLEEIPPATLDVEETRKFANIVATLPSSILSNESVQQARNRERQFRDEVETSGLAMEDGGRDLIEANPANVVYRILKTNRILGQILRNMHGKLEKRKVEDIIETIADSGLRLVNVVLKDEEEIARVAQFMHSKYPDWDMDKIKEVLEWFSFVWTVLNLEQIVDAVNVRDAREVLNDVVTKASNPAYDLIGYCSQLDTARELSDNERRALQILLKRHKDVFVRRVLSIRTQNYMNTHYTDAQMAQSICSLLEIPYGPRAIGARTSQ